jgi:hypothetical protein
MEDVFYEQSTMSHDYLKFFNQLTYVCISHDTRGQVLSRERELRGPRMLKELGTLLASFWYTSVTRCAKPVISSKELH